MRAAVVGHVEWLEFVPVEAVPDPGRSSTPPIVGASGRRRLRRGSAARAARRLRRLLYRVGTTSRGPARAELEGRGITVHATAVEALSARLHVVDDAGERTITTIGRKLHPRGHDESLPWHELARCDAVYFCAGDADALLLARRARVLVATARELPTLRQASVELDALVWSGKDEAERYHPGQLDPEPRARRDDVRRARRLGAARWPVQGGAASADPADAYGAGNCFAAGLAFGLARRARGSRALDFAARCGAGALAGPGVHAEAVALS